MIQIILEEGALRFILIIVAMPFGVVQCRTEFQLISETLVPDELVVLLVIVVRLVVIIVAVALLVVLLTA
jgi:hypothetical protein